MLYKALKRLFSCLVCLITFLGLWECVVLFSDIPSYLIPTPQEVGRIFIEDYAHLGRHAYVTTIEVLLSLVVGCSFGLFFAFFMLISPPVQRALNPVFVASQCIPTFAIAPLVILWLGFGMASKVVIASLLIFFPMTTNTYDGLAQTPRNYLHLAQTMHGKMWPIIRYIRIPAALPMIATGVKIAVVVAPIGAVIGEWAGASEGLGYFMMYSNSRMDVAGMFAALITLSLGAISFYYLTDYTLKKIVFWVDETALS